MYSNVFVFDYVFITIYTKLRPSIVNGYILGSIPSSVVDIVFDWLIDCNQPGSYLLLIRWFDGQYIFYSSNMLKFINYFLLPIDHTINRAPTCACGINRGDYIYIMGRCLDSWLAAHSTMMIHSSWIGVLVQHQSTAAAAADGLMCVDKHDC